jgi:hypothetical protein
VKKGERTEAEWAKVVKPDYSPLLWPSFWFNGPPSVHAKLDGKGQ